MQVVANALEIYLLPLLEFWNLIMGILVIGFRFHAKKRDSWRHTYNCLMWVEGDYHANLKEIMEVELPGTPIQKVVIFKYECFDLSL